MRSGDSLGTQEQRAPDEPKLLLSDVLRILLWSRRRQEKNKILKEAAGRDLGDVKCI